MLNFTADGAAPVQPVALSENPDSWLGFTDLVFVDPVGTGFSRAVGAGSEAEKPYYGVNQDADAMTDFVRLYLTRARPRADAGLSRWRELWRLSRLALSHAVFWTEASA